MQLNSLTCPTAMFNRMVEITKLLFKAARVRVEFTKEGWQQLLRLHPSPMSAFIQTVNIKADLGLYIATPYCQVKSPIESRFSASLFKFIQVISHGFPCIEYGNSVFRV